MEGSMKHSERKTHPNNRQSSGENFFLRKTRILFSRTNVSSNKYRDNFPPSFIHFIFFEKVCLKKK